MQCSSIQPFMLKNLTKWLFSQKSFWLDLLVWKMSVFFWVMGCGISSPFVVSSDLSLWRQGAQIQTARSERLLPRHGMCQSAGWRGLQLQCLQRNWVFCQSAPSILDSQNNLNVVSQPCAISRSAQTCTFSALQIKAYKALKQGCLGEGNVPSFTWKNPSAFHTFSLNRANHSKYSFMSVHSIIVCAAYLKNVLLDNLYLENHI